MGLGALIEAVDGLVLDDARTYADPDSVVELHRQLARLEAVVSRAVAAYDASGAWRRDGARSVAAAVAYECKVPVGEAKRRGRLGRAMRVLPVAEEAWLAGSITGAHVAKLASTRTPDNAERLADAEAVLVGNAKALSFKAFAKTVDYWRLRADPDGAARDDDNKRDDRSLHLSQSFRGLWFGSVTLDPVSGSIVANELRRIEQALFDADWRDAADRLGRPPTIFDLERTPAQRRADALVEMATRSGATPPGSRRPEPLFTVLVGWETLHGQVCELSDRTVVSPGSLIPWLDAARLERVVFGPDSRVLDVGVSQRLFQGATRRAVQVRDHAIGCFNPTCDENPERCQVDHIIPASAGGPTNQTNGRLACGTHNRRRHQRPPP